MEAVALFRPPQGQSDDLPLPKALQFELWSQIAGRLEAGASLITPAHFQRAMEAAYLDLVGAPPSERSKANWAP